METHHDFWTIFWTLFFTLLIIIMYLARNAPKIGQGFKLNYFLTDNAYRIFFNLSLTIYLLVGGEWIIHFLYEALNTQLLNRWSLILDPDGSSGVVGVSLISSVLSYFIFKVWKPIEKYKEKKKEEMHKHNDSCKH